MLFDMTLLLGFRTVNELANTMSYEEYIMWGEYFSKRPPGWREDLRAYQIIRGFGMTKSKPEDLFPSLDPIMNTASEPSLAASFKKSAFGKMVIANSIEEVPALKELL
jgi:hypothetical protein